MPDPAGRTTTFALATRRRLRARLGVPLYEPGAQVDAAREWAEDVCQSPLDAVPICLPDWRAKFGLDEPVPPPLLPMTTETCEVCGRPTTAGLYLLRGES